MFLGKNIFHKNDKNKIKIRILHEYQIAEMSLIAAKCKVQERKRDNSEKM